MVILLLFPGSVESADDVTLAQDSPSLHASSANHFTPTPSPTQTHTFRPSPIHPPTHGHSHLHPPTHTFTLTHVHLFTQPHAQICTHMFSQTHAHAFTFTHSSRQIHNSSPVTDCKGRVVLLKDNLSNSGQSEQGTNHHSRSHAAPPSGPEVCPHLPLNPV